MLIIRREQMEALGRARECRFVLKAVEHLETVLPERCRDLGRAAVLASVRTALRKGREYQLHSERDFLRYLNLMYVLGFQFDTDLPWAAELLTDGQLDPEVKLALLMEGARAELRRRAERVEGAGV